MVLSVVDAQLFFPYTADVSCAGVAELVYARDSKSRSRKGLWVRVPPPAPALTQRNFSAILCKQ